MVRDAFSTPGDALGLLLFTPAFVFALYLVIGRYVLDALKRRNTTYLITDRRAVIVSGLLRKRAKSRVITPEMEATVSRARWGRRALMIGPGADGYDFILRRSMFSRVHCHPFAFERLPDALRAYKILRKQQKASA